MEKIPEILYHETTEKRFIETLEECGRYYSEGLDCSIYCCEGSSTTSMGYAFQRAKFYNSNPILLIIFTDKLDREVINESSRSNIYLIQGSISPEAFEIFRDFPNKKGAIDIEHLVKIQKIIEKRRSRK